MLQQGQTSKVNYPGQNFGPSDLSMPVPQLLPGYGQQQQQTGTPNFGGAMLDPSRGIVSPETGMPYGPLDTSLRRPDPSQPILQNPADTWAQSQGISYQGRPGDPGEGYYKNGQFVGNDLRQLGYNAPQPTQGDMNFGLPPQPITQPQPQSTTPLNLYNQYAQTLGFGNPQDGGQQPAANMTPPFGIMGGGFNPNPGPGFNYADYMNGPASYGISNGQPGNFTPVRRSEEASNRYYENIVNAAGGYQDWKKANPGKDVFSISNDFRALTPEQQYSYLNPGSFDISNAVRTPPAPQPAITMPSPQQPGMATRDQLMTRLGLMTPAGQPSRAPATGLTAPGVKPQGFGPTPSGLGMALAQGLKQNPNLIGGMAQSIRPPARTVAPKPVSRPVQQATKFKGPSTRAPIVRK
jgi:hypothetical protein